MKRTQWIAFLAAVLLFCCGAAVGVLGDRLYEGKVVVAKTAADYRARYINEMQTKLNLTSKQVGQLQDILDDTKARVKAVRDQYHPAMIKIKEEQVSRVKSILTPQQIPAYEQLVAEHERRAREQEEHDRAEDQRRAAARRATP